MAVLLLPSTAFIVAAIASFPPPPLPPPTPPPLPPPVPHHWKTLVTAAAAAVTDNLETATRYGGKRRCGQARV